MKLVLLFNSPLGARSAPIGVNKPQIAPALAAGLIAGGATIASGIGSLISQANTNNTNERINEANLAAQRENWKREQENFLLQRQWQLQDTESERQYNSPVSQVARFRAAGINPYLAMYGGASAETKQAVSSPSAPSFGSPPSSIPMQSYDFSQLGNGISKTAEIYYLDKAEERADYQLANDITVSRQNARTNFLNAITEAKKQGVEEKNLRFLIDKWTQEFDLSKQEFAHRLEMDDINVDIQHETLKLKRDELEISKQLARIQEKVASSQIQLNDEMAAKAAEEAASTKATVQEMLKNGASQRRINAFIERQQKATAKMLEIDAARSQRNDILGVRQSYRDFTEWLFTPIKGIVSFK